MDLGDFLSSISTRSTPNVESIIVSFIDNEKNDKQVANTSISKLLICFQLNQTNLLDFFEKMQFYLTNGRESTRRKATELVVELFTRYSGLKVDIDALSTLFTYFVNRVFDVATVKPTLQLLLQFLKNITRNYPETTTTTSSETHEAKRTIITSIVATLNDARFSVSAYAQDVRDAVYQLLKYMQEKFAAICIELNSDFIKTILESTEDEKDPRCIMKSFQLVQFVLDRCSETHTKPFLEDIFDNLECYYPIDFQNDPEQDKKHQITSVQLARSLDSCLTSHLILPKTLHLLHEKIHSSYLDAKIAALNTYTIIFKKYKPHMFTSAQRDQILNDLLENAKDIEEEDLSESVVNCIQEYVYFLHSTHGIDSNILDISLYEDLKKIEKHILSLLEDGFMHHNALLSEKIVTAVTSVNENTRYLMLNYVVRYFNSRFTNKDSSVAAKVLEYVLLVLLAAEKHLKAQSSLFNAKFKIDPLRESEIDFLDVCVDIGITETQLEEYSTTVKKCLIEYAYLLASHLPNTEDHVCFLELKLLGVIEQKNMLECVVNGFNSMVLTNTKGWVRVIEHVMKNLNNPALKPLIEAVFTKVIALNKSQVNDAIFAAVREMTRTGNADSSSENKNNTLNGIDSQIASFLKIIISRKKLSKEDGKIEEEEEKKEGGSANIIEQLVASEYSALTLFTKFIKSAAVEPQYLKGIFQNFIAAISSEDSSLLLNISQIPFVKSIAIYFGNHLQDLFEETQVQQVSEKLSSIIIRESGSVAATGMEQEYPVLIFCSRVLRGLLLRMNSFAFTVFSGLIEKELKNEIDLPLQFYTIVMARTDVRKKSLSYSATASQRLFVACVFAFHAKLKSITERHSTMKNKCYHVLTTTLLASPFAIITENKQVCLPILIEALTFASESASLESAIKLLTRLLSEDLKIIGSNSENLIECLLKLLDSNETNSRNELSMTCIVEIIKCLAQCIRFETYIVKRFKSRMLDVMDVYLGHHKRRVRKQAVYTVNQWHQII